MMNGAYVRQASDWWTSLDPGGEEGRDAFAETLSR